MAGNGSFIGGIPAFFPHSRLDDGMLDRSLTRSRKKETVTQAELTVLPVHLAVVTGDNH
ncbi:hypothetical protein [Desmospora profundinema]|uniref:Diacylglycerol kinase family enzyme n=1 Tax=Desmospora profundinema TaxID=1571184 RepID=A0ABU1IRP0_9BACL|nr:hypothetical protein [Desmospora profundinema]MDR6227465.1 diacylglycerol kinase family enzyme [Desmospora profundinema]